MATKNTSRRQAYGWQATNTKRLIAKADRFCVSRVFRGESSHV
jgi:hypothetical protein